MERVVPRLGAVIDRDIPQARSAVEQCALGLVSFQLRKELFQASRLLRPAGGHRRRTLGLRLGRLELLCPVRDPLTAQVPIKDAVDGALRWVLCRLLVVCSAALVQAMDQLLGDTPWDTGDVQKVVAEWTHDVLIVLGKGPSEHVESLASAVDQHQRRHRLVPLLSGAHNLRQDLARKKGQERVVGVSWIPVQKVVLGHKAVEMR